jgi:hypothetical protein
MNLHTEQTRPHITLWTLDSNTDYPNVNPGTIKREFLDETLNSHGYHCHPMASANLHGWEFLLPQDVEVIWDGISDTTPDHVEVIKGKTLPDGRSLVDTSTANGTITFNTNCFIETDENHYLLLSGPPNYFIDGAKPMNALVRSDIWHASPIQYCWKMTTPNKPVLFKKGTPIMFFINYPIGLLEKTVLNIKPATNEILLQSSNYGGQRASMYEGFNGKNFPMLYKKNVKEDEKTSIEKTLKPNPQTPIIENK